MSELNQKIQDILKTAMRAKDKDRVAVIRLITAAIKQKEVDERIELSDDQILAVLDKMLKQRRESIAQYEKGNRQDLIDVEEFEINIIQEFLPEPLTDAEIDAIIEQAVSESSASSIKDMGKVMGLIKPQVQGRADMGLISKKIKEKLN